jgi:TrmH family RNA methyltransferase
MLQPAESLRLLVLDGIQDPGNVGTILRTAAAFGIATVVLDRACADPWSPKVLRAAAGGHFALSIRQVSSLVNEIDGFEGQRVCTTIKDGVDLKAATLSHPLGWIFGSEGRGVSPELQKAADLRVTIPIAQSSESLNVASAAAICLHEGTRA